MQRRPSWLVIALLLSAMLVMAACSSDDGGGGLETGVAGETTSTTGAGDPNSDKLAQILARARSLRTARLTTLRSPSLSKTPFDRPTRSARQTNSRPAR